jgi:acyl dehydratase
MALGNPVKGDERMAEGSLITPEIRAMLGQEVYFAGKEVIDRTAIKRYAQAISDLHPLYIDEEFAKKRKYGGVIAPPTFIFDVSHDIFAEIGEDGRDLSRVTIRGLNAVRGGNEYQFFEPARPGDIINRRRKITDIYEKKGKKAGMILFVVYATTYTNQKDKLLGVCREIMMFVK